MALEIWKDIEGYEGLYQVSNLGNIKNNKGLIMRSSGNKKGYLQLDVGGTKRIHRLVAENFIPNPQNKPQVNHINGIKTDNRVENLEWVTASENNIHKFRTLNYKNNFQNGQNIVYKNIGQYDIEGKLIKIWESLAGISEFGFHSSCIYLVIKGKRSTHKNFIWKLI